MKEKEGAPAGTLFLYASVTLTSSWTGQPRRS